MEGTTFPVDGAPPQPYGEAGAQQRTGECPREPEAAPHPGDYAYSHHVITESAATDPPGSRQVHHEEREVAEDEPDAGRAGQPEVPRRDHDPEGGRSPVRYEERHADDQGVNDVGDHPCRDTG